MLMFSIRKATYESRILNHDDLFSPNTSFIILMGVESKINKYHNIIFIYFSFLPDFFLRCLFASAMSTKFKQILKHRKSIKLDERAEKICFMEIIMFCLKQISSSISEMQTMYSRCFFLFNILINDSFLYIYKNVQVTDALNWDIYFKFIN